MKNANVGSKKIVKTAQPRRVAGVPVRSGIKAGRRWDAGNVGGGGGGDRDLPGGPDAARDFWNRTP